MPGMKGRIVNESSNVSKQEGSCREVCEGVSVLDPNKCSFLLSYSL